MNTSRTEIVLSCCLLAASATAALAADEGMPHMPLAREKSSRTVATGDDFGAVRGFGPDEPAARMRTLMMVGGSGHEGMEMKAPARTGSTEDGAPFEAQWTISPSPPTVGSGTLELTLLDPKTRKPLPGLEVHLEASMATMNMGTQALPAPEVAPGHYRAELKFPMAGPWAIRIHTRLGESELRLEVGAPQ